MKGNGQEKAVTPILGNSVKPEPIPEATYTAPTQDDIDNWTEGAFIKDDKEEQLKEKETIKDRVREHKSKGWKLTEPDDPDQIVEDIMDWHEEMVDLAVEWYTEEHGFKPNLPLRSSCETGDWSDSAVFLDHAEKEIETTQNYLNLMRNNKRYNSYWGGLGYLLWGTPFEDIPDIYKDYLQSRFAE